MDWITLLSRQFARRLVQEAEMDEFTKVPHFCAECGRSYLWSADDIAWKYEASPFIPCGHLWKFLREGQTFAQGECPNCGHDWTAHSDFIARGEKVCWTFDPAIMDERHPYYVADRIASECDIADELVAVICIQYDERDELGHTDEHPFCDDPSCGCHDDIDLLKEQVFEPFFNGLLTALEAHRFMEGKQL